MGNALVTQRCFYDTYKAVKSKHVHVCMQVSRKFTITYCCVDKV